MSLLALVGLLSALAGGLGKGDAVPVARPAGAALLPAWQASTAQSPVAARAERPSNAPGPAAMEHPFAPGGDELLPAQESLPLRPWQSPAEGDEAHSAAAELPGNGRLSVRVVVPGRHPVTVGRQGPGGRTDRNADPVVPLRLANTSCPKRMPCEARTEGDFFQEGRRALFVVSAGVDGVPMASLLALDPLGQWADRSAELLIGPAQRRSCTTPSQAISADFDEE